MLPILLQIDESVVAEMSATGDDLKKYLPKYGDRIVAVAFAARQQAETSKPTYTDKELMVENVRKALGGGAARNIQGVQRDKKAIIMRKGLHVGLR